MYLTGFTDHCECAAQCRRVPNVSEECFQQLVQSKTLKKKISKCVLDIVVKMSTFCNRTGSH